MNDSSTAGGGYADLVSRFLDGPWAGDDDDALRRALRDSAECRESLVDQLILDSLLEEDLGPESLTAAIDLMSGAVGDRASAAAGMSAGHHGSRGRFAGWMVVAACLAGIAFGAIWWEPSSRATAAVVIRAAESVHADSLARVYAVEVEREPGHQASFMPPRDARITTQGDRFFVTMSRGPREWTWGRDATGSIWLTLGRHRAIVVASDELGPPLRYLSDLYALEIENLLQNFRRHCDLERTADGVDSHLIHATPRVAGGRWGFLGATIEVDRESKVVRRLTLEREVPEFGRSTITFTLVDTRPADERLADPAGHLEEPFQLITRSIRPDRRRDVLVNWFGPAADRWIIIPEDSADDR